MTDFLQGGRKPADSRGVRLRRTISVFVASLTLLSLAAPVLAADEEWEFDGGGWGHGVGLSQFGALGQAQDGRNATQILQHYYTGTSVAVDAEQPLDQTAQCALGGSDREHHSGRIVTAVGGASVDLSAGGNRVHPGPDRRVSPTSTINPGEAWVFERQPLEPQSMPISQEGRGQHWMEGM